MDEEQFLTWDKEVDLELTLSSIVCRHPFSHEAGLVKKVQREYWHGVTEADVRRWWFRRTNYQYRGSRKVLALPNEETRIGDANIANAFAHACQTMFVVQMNLRNPVDARDCLLAAAIYRRKASYYFHNEDNNHEYPILQLEMEIDRIDRMIDQGTVQNYRVSNKEWFCGLGSQGDVGAVHVKPQVFSLEHSDDRRPEVDIVHMNELNNIYVAPDYISCYFYLKSRHIIIS